MKKKLLIVSTALCFIIAAVTFMPAMLSANGTTYPDVVGSYTIRCNLALCYLDGTRVLDPGTGKKLPCKEGYLHILTQADSVITGLLELDNVSEAPNGIPLEGYVAKEGGKIMRLVLYGDLTIVGEALTGDEIVIVTARIKTDKLGAVTRLTSGRITGVDFESTVYTFMGNFKAAWGELIPI